MEIKKAVAKDAEELTALTLRSKSHWNYSKEQIEGWKQDLTINTEHIKRNNIYKFVDNGFLIGFYSYKIEKDEVIRLGFFFIEPKYIGKGYGGKMISDFLERIKKEGFKRVVLDADPNAANFYKGHGFRVIGKLESAIKNRYLPIMELKFD